MFVPIHDDNPLRSISFQYVTIGLIAINVAVFAFTAMGVPQNVALSFALVPAEFFDEGLFGLPTYQHRFSAVDVRERWTLLSYMFMHGNILHLLGNMVFLWVFGDNVEDAMGHFRFLVFYLLCGVFAGLAHSALMPSSQAPLIGASGAVAGVVVAYLIMNPRVNLWVLFLPFFPVKLTAGVALGLWVALQFIMPFVNSVSPTAWWAHIGGIVAGVVLVFVFRRANATMTMSGGPGNQHR